jgi:hypothetical protein
MNLSRISGDVEFKCHKKYGTRLLRVEELSSSKEIKGKLVSYDRNFPCQTLKIRNVSLVVMGS